jgi:hypothetical protein
MRPAADYGVIAWVGAPSVRLRQARQWMYSAPGTGTPAGGGSLKKWVLGFSFMRLQVRARGTAGGRWAAGLGESSQPARS